jgi:hypothetical protein
VSGMLGPAKAHPLSPTAYGSSRTLKHPQRRRRAWLSAHFRELEELAGGFRTKLDRRDAGMVAYLWAEWRSILEDMEAARRQREDGRGRRTSAQQMARYQKRLGLALADYTAARTRFEERVKGNGHPGPTLADIRQRYQGHA